MFTGIIRDARKNVFELSPRPELEPKTEIMPEKKLVLIDGHALAYRVFFGLPLEAFTTKSGEPTNATFGFTRTIMDQLFAKNPPQYLAVSFDVGKTFRDEMFAEYKGTREKMPDELRVQIDRIREVVRKFNIPVLELNGFEADDVLGTIAKQAKPLGVPVKIITGDRDLLQLVDDNTEVELPPGRFSNKPQIFDEDAVIAKYGIRPDQIVDWKAMTGDTSDNIPGVMGVGDKTAVNLLQTYGTLDNIYENLEEVKTRFRNKLEVGKDSAYLSQKLAQIVTDAPITLDIEACVAHDFDANEVLAIFQELEFRSLTSRLIDATGAEEGTTFTGDALDTPEPTETILVQTEKDLAAMVKALNSAKLIAFDCETTGLNKMTAKLVGISLAVEAPKGYYIPIGHIDNQEQASSGQMMLFASETKLASDQLSLERVIEAIKPAMTNSEIPKVAHNAKFDYIILDRHGLTVSPVGGDTMISEWLSDPGTKFKGLKDLSLQRLGIEMTNIESLIGKGRNQKSFAEVPIADAAPYAAADADVTLRLYEPLQEEVKEKGMLELQALELELIPILADMEQAGIGVDIDFFQTMSAELGGLINAAEEKIYAIAGHPFNINSTQQLSDVLFKELDLPHERLRRTKSGHYSTASDVLENLKPSDEHGIVTEILAYREMQKLKSTYVDALPELVNEETGRIHTSFNQTGAITGRIASSNPNLQNIPIRTEQGQRIRRGFVSRPGWQFLAADYSQVELRILAHISQDEALLEAFRLDQDIHSTTAAAVYGVPLEKVEYNQRRFAKAVNFGLIYGMGAFRLARDSDLTLAEAENFIKTYFERFPGINEYLKSTKEKARAQGYVETLFGRRRYFPVFRVASGRANQQAVNRAEREAVNHPIQGTAADIVKIAMVRLHKALTASYKAKMLLQVHDELVLEVPDNEVEVVRQLVLDTMSGAFELDVPLKVEASVGRNWLELKD